VSLRVRLLAAFAYVLVLVIVALEVPLALNLSRRVDAEIKREAQGEAQLLAAGAAGRLDEPRRLARLVRGAAGDLGGRVIVVDRRGRLLVDSAGAGLRSTSYATRPEIARALRGRASQGTRHSDSLGVDLLFTAVPIVRENRRAGAVRVTQSVEAVQREVRQDVIALVGVGAVALLLGLGVAWLLAGSLARPLRGLADAARRVAGGDLDARARIEGSAEQREVAGAFNEMTGRLGRTLRAQQEFVANASHQLRTPLTGLRLRLEAAALKSRDPEVERELAAAERETERLARLLAELLVLARERERPPAVPIELAEAAEAARDRWEGPAERSGHSLRLGGGPRVVVAASNEDLAIILDNLVSNAVGYSPPGTTVTIEWDGGEVARLAVLDEGPGVEPDERERVFERFYRGAAGGGAVGGTGLGLSVVEALVRRWGGAVSLDNRLEGGARAEVTLPLHRDERALPNPAQALDGALPERG
jgi:signal transduction histidine kinase